MIAAGLLPLLALAAMRAAKPTDLIEPHPAEGVLV